MPLFTIARFFLALASIALLALAGYLIWTWWESGLADWSVRGAPDAAPTRDLEDWGLWLGLALLGFSFLGRLIVTPLLARSSRGDEHFRRGPGRTITSASGPLYVEEHGAQDRPTIILTHGQGLDATLWAPYVERLAPGYRVVTWDLPALGRSARAGDTRVEAAALALRDLVRLSASGPVVLVGHSYGAMAIQELAGADPDFIDNWVAGIVFLHTTHCNPLKTMIFARTAQKLQKPVLEPMSALTVALEPLAWVSNWQSYLSGMTHLATRLQCGPEVTRAQLDHFSLSATKNRPAAIERRNVAMYHWRGFEGAEVEAPALVIGGGADIVTKAQASNELAKLWPRASLHIVRGANHLTPFERYDEYARLIADFAASVTPDLDAAAPGETSRARPGEPRDRPGPNGPAMLH